VTINKFTKWIEYKSLIKYSIAKAVEFIQDIMLHFGMPNRVITDLGPPFTAIEFRSWAQDCSINIDYASVVHPQANEQVERAKGLILTGLKPRLYEELEDYGSKWIKELLKVVWGATNSSQHSYRILTIFSSIWIRSSVASRLDLDITKDMSHLIF
jgi:transposase InsO family protein